MPISMIANLLRFMEPSKYGHSPENSDVLGHDG